MLQSPSNGTTESPRTLDIPGLAAVLSRFAPCGPCVILRNRRFLMGCARALLSRTPGNDRPPGERSSPELTGVARQRPAPFDAPPTAPQSSPTSSLASLGRPSHATRRTSGPPRNARHCTPPGLRLSGPTSRAGLRKGPTARGFRRRKHCSEAEGRAKRAASQKSRAGGGFRSLSSRSNCPSQSLQNNHQHHANPNSVAVHF